MIGDDRDVQCPDGEIKAEADLTRGGNVQLLNDGNGKTEDDEDGDHAHCAAGHIEGIGIDGAGTARDVVVPEVLDGLALQDNDKEGGDDPADHENAYIDDGFAHPMFRKETDVEEEDGDGYEKNRDDADNLLDVYELRWMWLVAILTG